VLEFRLLGPLEVRDGERVIELPRHKQRALLAALALRPGRVVSKDELLEDLWGAHPPPRAESSLQNLLSQLRRALGPEHVVTRAPGYLLRVEPEQVAWLEERCDAVNETLEPLRSFVLNGGTPLGAQLHLARTVARRAEREIVALAAQEQVSGAALAYVNRLSDLLFILARAANPPGSEVLWVPGGDRA